MPMSALVSSMPMPSCAIYTVYAVVSNGSPGDFPYHAHRANRGLSLVVCPFVYEETNGRYPFANGLNRLAHLWFSPAALWCCSMTMMQPLLPRFSNILCIHLSLLYKESFFVPTKSLPCPIALLNRCECPVLERTHYRCGTLFPYMAV
jgi:hypothetical protein